MDLERQTQFCDIPWARERSSGPFLDPAQPVTHGVGMTTQSFSGDANRAVSFLPHPKRFEQDLALLVGKVAKRGQSSAGRFDHHLWGGERGGGQDASVEHRDMGIGSGRPRSVTLAKCKACGVSRRSLNRALTRRGRPPSETPKRQHCRVAARMRRAQSRPANRATAATPNTRRDCATSIRGRQRLGAPERTSAAMTTKGPSFGSRRWPATSHKLQSSKTRPSSSASIKNERRDASSSICRFCSSRYPATTAVPISSAKPLMRASVSAGIGPGSTELTVAKPHTRPSTMTGTPTAARTPTARTNAATRPAVFS